MTKKKGSSFEDELIDDLNSSFAKKSSNATASYLWQSTADVKNWISTGSFMLDLVLSNRKDGGIPTGRLTEISGGEGAGKTLLASYILADTQRKGGVAILIDSEHAASMDVLKASGVDVEKLVYSQCNTIEDVFHAMERIVSMVKTSGQDRPITIVWDSVAATSSRAEVEGNYGDATVGLAARLISQALRKYIPICSKHNICLVFINQLRTKIGVSFGDNNVTPGGGMCLATLVCV
jgi:recombination protein RecA